MIPKSAKRFSDQIMRQEERMIPKSAKRFLDRIMRKKDRMIPKSGYWPEGVMPQPAEA
jgi:hypothetical protein